MIDSDNYEMHTLSTSGHLCTPYLARAFGTGAELGCRPTAVLSTSHSLHLAEGLFLGCQRKGETGCGGPCGGEAADHCHPVIAEANLWHRLHLSENTKSMYTLQHGQDCLSPACNLTLRVQACLSGAVPKDCFWRSRTPWI